jgi:hypothetical protein
MCSHARPHTSRLHSSRYNRAICYLLITPIDVRQVLSPRHVQYCAHDILVEWRGVTPWQKSKTVSLREDVLAKSVTTTLEREIYQHREQVHAPTMIHGCVPVAAHRLAGWMPEPSLPVDDRRCGPRFHRV